MSKERSAAITIGGKEYELVLTTRATKEIAGRYGGLENLGDRLMKSENFEMALDEIIWLITLLANQSVLIHNLQHPEDKKEPLTQDAVELLTSPFELAGYKEAIMPSSWRGTRKPSWKPCTRAPSGISKARRTQKTWKSGNRRRAVYPAFLLRYRPAGVYPGGNHAPALWLAAGSVGVPQAVPRSGEAQAGADH